VVGAGASSHIASQLIAARRARAARRGATTSARATPVPGYRGRDRPIPEATGSLPLSLRTAQLRGAWSATARFQVGRPILWRAAQGDRRLPMSIDPADHGPHHGHMRGSCRVYLESGKTWVFAVALEWPGWCRRGRGEAAALQALVDYAPRYGAAIGPSFSAEPLQVVGHVSGARWTDFGVPGPAEPWAGEPHLLDR